MKTFHLVRDHDVSGVSGTGTVAEGVVFADGTVAMRWCTDDNPRSTTFYASIDDVLTIHGHTGLTSVVYEDTAEDALASAAKRIGDFDPSDKYEMSSPGRHIPGFPVGYYAAIDRVENLLNGKIKSWSDDRPIPENRLKATP